MATAIRNWIRRYEDYLPWRRRRYRRCPAVVRRWPSPTSECKTYFIVFGHGSIQLFTDPKIRLCNDNDAISIKSFDLCINENGPEHHTKNFYAMKQNPNNETKLIVRRGQPFKIRLTLNKSCGQIQKQSLAGRIIDRSNIEGYVTSKEKLTTCLCEYESTTTEFDSNSKYMDNVLNKVIQQYGSRIAQKPFEHKNLLVDINGESLSDSDKQLAMKNYLMQRSPVPQQLLVKKIVPAQVELAVKKLRSVSPLQDTVQDENHSWIGAENWIKNGFAAEAVICPKDIIITTNNNKMMTVKEGRNIVGIHTIERTYIETEHGVHSISGSEFSKKN